MNKKNSIRIAIVVLIIFVGVGIWLGRGTRQVQPKFTGPVQEIRIETEEKSTLSALLWVADAQGYFADYGLNVKLREHKSGVGAVDVFLNGGVDLATSIEFPLASKLIERDDLRVVASIGAADTVKIISRRDRIVSLSDLAGKKIGLFQRGMLPFLLARTLIQEGISYEKVTIVDMFPSQMEGALARGEVDAVVIWPPHTLNIKEVLGDEVMSWSAQAGQELNWLLFGFETWIEKHPETLKRLLGALVEAERFARTNEEETKKYSCSKT